MIPIWRIREKIKFVISRGIVYISGRAKSSKMILENYRNKYKGQRCFIICNGPSLTASDLDMLKDEITFASNRIYNIFSKTEWRPTFWAIFDVGVIKLDGAVDGINSIPAEMKFTRDKGYLDFKGIKGRICYLHSWDNRSYLNNPKFSDDLTKGIYGIATVTYNLIQIARFMGFDKIYIIGADHHYKNMETRRGNIIVDPSAKSYFGNIKDTSGQAPAGVWEMEVAYEYAEKYSREHGFRIYNATRGGHLDVFERVNLNDVLNG